MEKRSRRSFLRTSALGGAFLALTALLLGAVRTMIPALMRDKSAFKIGRLADFPINSFTLIRDAEIFVYRDHQGVRAVSAVCTHLGCILQTAEEGFQCPCHGSYFDARGAATSGPAPRSLAWYKVYLGPDGQLVVDKRIRLNAEEKLHIS